MKVKRIGIMIALATLLWVLIPQVAHAVSQGVANINCATTTTPIYTANAAPRGQVLMTNGGSSPIFVCFATTCTNLTGFLIGPGETFGLGAFNNPSGAGYIYPPGAESYTGPISCISDVGSNILSVISW